MIDRPCVSRGARVCRRITRRYAKTFYFASGSLPRPTRAHAYAVYGFCRWADNAVDEASDPFEAANRLDRAREALAIAYGRQNAAPGLLSFRKTVRDRGIPRDLFEALLDGMEMDLKIRRYADFASLDTYCYRVAGVVGLMMTHIFGYRHERCLPRAIALGKAMQLTNILRDVAEDQAMGRVYLPQDELARFGVSETQIAQGQVDEAFRSLLRFQIDRARAFYAEAEAGIPDLIGASSRVTVRVMSGLYAKILEEIEDLDYQIFQTRAHVPWTRKLKTLATCQGAEFRANLTRFWG